METHETTLTVEAAPWKVCLSDAVRVAGPDHVFGKFPTRRSALLLIRLALSPKRAFSRDELCRILWPDDSPETTRSLLRNEIARLRRSLEDAAEILVADRASVYLNGEVATTDLSEMLQAVRAAARAETPASRLDLYTKAASFDAGAILAGFDEDWIQVERDRFKNYARMVWIGLGRAQYETGDREAALESFLTSIRLEPLHEEAYLAAMVLADEMARPAEAIRLYQQLESNLQKHLDTKPSNAVRTVYDRIRRPDTTAPEAVIAEAPKGMPPSNIPVPVTRIVGRDGELAKITEWIHPDAPGAGRLVTLLGPGGMGKSRLAIEAANHLKDAYKNNAWFVGLVDVVDPKFLGASILDALGIEHHGSADVLMVLQSRLPHEPSLMVLDNFEQLVDGGAEFILRLLETNPHLRLLVTSRQTLGLGGEAEFPVEPLDCNGEHEGAVELFLEVARAGGAKLMPDAATIGIISQIVSKLEGIPLAIHLAASRSNVLTPRDMLGQLEDRFTFLVSRRADLSERHRRLADTIDWTYRLMPPDLQRFFCELSVFRGGWTLQAAEKVLRSDDALGVTEQLRDRSLILAYPTSDGMRFRMLETLREFALRQLGEEREAEIRSRHLSYFYGLADVANKNLLRAEQLEWYSRLDREHDNLHVALEWSAQHDLESAYSLCSFLWRFWSVRSHHLVARVWQERILSGAVPTSYDVASALFGAAIIAAEQSDYETAHRWYDRSLAMYKEIKLDWGIYLVTMNMASTYANEGKFNETLELATKCLEHWRSVDHPYSASFALEEIARAEIATGDIDKALLYAEECYELRKVSNDVFGMAGATATVGDVHFQKGDLNQAMADYQRALDTHRQFNNLQGIAQMQGKMAVIDILVDRLPDAAARLRECEGAYQAIGDRSGRTTVKAIECQLLIKRHAFGAALYSAKKALRYALDLNIEATILSRMETLAAVWHATGDSARAARILGACESARTESQIWAMPFERKQVEQLKAEVERELGAVEFRSLLLEGSGIDIGHAADQALRPEATAA